MNRQPSLPNADKEEVYRLAVGVLENDISEDDARRFERLIADDPTARGWYVDLLFDVCSLQRMNRGQDNGVRSPGETALPFGSAEEELSRSTPAEPLLPAKVGPALGHKPSQLGPIVIVVGDAKDEGPGRILDGWPFAYLMSTVICGLGLLIGSLVQVSTPVQVAQEPAAPIARQGDSHIDLVGRITAMVDCRFVESPEPVASGQRPVASGQRPVARGQGPVFNPQPSTRVSLGDSYALCSGLLEITYDTGAKVILQGPCTYEVESASGGYLSVGKLTARVESRESRVESNETTAKSQAAAHSPLSTLHSPLFAVRTPTATVTDLGTEFGVEVAAGGTVQTTVFSGKVALAARGQLGAEPRILTTGQSARVLMNDGVASVNVGAVHGVRFVRSLRATRSEILIGPAVCNGSFEYPALGPNYFDADAGNSSIGVYAKIHDVVPPYWNPTSSLQTKGTFVSGVTGEQYVVLQSPSPVLSTRFDGAEGHPDARKYEPHTVYVLTADFGSNIAGMEVAVCFEDGEHTLRRAVPVLESNVMQPMPPMELDTDRDREFVGKPIAISFSKRNEGDQLYIDNVTLKAVRRFAAAADSPTPQ